jgi:hypothetical protein
LLTSTCLPAVEILKVQSVLSFPTVRLYRSKRGGDLSFRIRISKQKQNSVPNLFRCCAVCSTALIVRLALQEHILYSQPICSTQCYYPRLESSRTIILHCYLMNSNFRLPLLPRITTVAENRVTCFPDKKSESKHNHSCKTCFVPTCHWYKVNNLVGVAAI